MKKIDISNLKLLSDGGYKTEHLVSETETEDLITRTVVFTIKETGEQAKSVYKRQKFLCIGGPFDGQKKQAYGFDNEGYMLEGYLEYNAGYRNYPKVLYIWNELIPKTNLKSGVIR